MRGFRFRKVLGDDLLASELYNNETFYKAFLNDLRCAQHEVIIESPFITSRRMSALYPAIQDLIDHGVRIAVNTRNPIEHENDVLKVQAEVAIIKLQSMGVQVLFTAGHHRKLGIIDRAVLWEGSLNILSQNDSAEIMRRIASPQLAEQMIHFLRLDKFCKWYS
jgi:phosphatidylserine/phosphatidylglycerophosphate/cardiolipin synthase-like enzyme